MSAVSRLFCAIGSLIGRRVRLIRLNRMSGVRVAASARIAKTALIQMDFGDPAARGSVSLAHGVTISDGAILATYGGTIAIEANSYIGPYCILYGHGGLAIGANTMIGAHTVIVPFNHGISRADMPMAEQPLTKKGIRIGPDVWIGAGCKILDGVQIGEGVVIGAGSVVTKSIPIYSIAFGVPATVTRSRLK